LSLGQQADDSPGGYATIDHSDIRGSEPQGHDPSGAASDDKPIYLNMFRNGAPVRIAKSASGPAPVVR